VGVDSAADGPDPPGDRLAEIRRQLDAVHAAREACLGECRVTIRLAGRSIRAVHRLDRQAASALLAESGAALRRAQAVVAPFPALVGAGFLHDAEKEYAEAALTAALVAARPLPSAADLAVGLPAWLNGLAEAASELRRHLLDRLRSGEVDRAEDLLGAMEGVYDLLVGIDYPDAVSGGLRRSTDALRAVLERTRSDVTLTMLQERLRVALSSKDRSPGT